ncbi:MAG: YncE family protein, partial [Bryobacteraceae bacterium]
MPNFTVAQKARPVIMGLVVLTLYGNLGSREEDHRVQALLPTGKRITPTAAPGSHFQMLNPGLKAFPDFVAGQAISTAVSPDQRTLLILTSGFNRINGTDGKPIPHASEEYVFVYDISHAEPQQVQVLRVPDTFAGLAFSPDGKQFYVSGGKDDNVHLFALDSTHHWSENGTPIKLGHSSGLGLQIGKEPLAAGGLAVTQNGEALAIANVYNDSISIVDLQTRRVSAELDLRPGKIDAANAGVPGGEYPFWVSVKGNTTAYVSSLRDREIVVVSLA